MVTRGEWAAYAVYGGLVAWVWHRWGLPIARYAVWSIVVLEGVWLVVQLWPSLVWCGHVVRQLLGYRHEEAVAPGQPAAPTRSLLGTWILVVALAVWVVGRRPPWLGPG